jgi:uncharacterized membrane protein
MIVETEIALRSHHIGSAYHSLRQLILGQFPCKTQISYLELNLVIILGEVELLNVVVELETNITINVLW